MKPVRYGISAKFILFISITLIIFFTVTLIVIYGVMRSYTLSNAEELSSTILEETDKKIDRFFLEMEHLARGLANYKSVYNVEVDHMRDLFISIVMARKQYLRAIYLGTEDGRMFEWGYGKGFKDYTPTLPANYDPRVRPWYKKGVMVGDFAISEPYVYASVKALGITGVVPVYRPDGEFVGILGLDILLDDLKTVLEDLEIPKNGKAVLLNKDGYVIASQLSGYSENELTLKKFELVESSKLFEKKRGHFIKMIGSVKMYFSYKINSRTNWVLVLAFPYNLIMETVNRILSSILLINIFLMVMLVIALSLISEKILIQPLDEIIKVINRLENGERYIRVNVRTNDEFGVLAMELNKLVDTVEAYSSSLEKKVRERTDEIALLQKENTRLRIIEEKKRIYRDMHDALGAKLTNIFICNTVAQSIVKSEETGNKSYNGRLLDMMKRIEVNCDSAIKNLKEIVFGMKSDDRITSDFSRLMVLNIKRRLELKHIELDAKIENPEKLNQQDNMVRDEIEKILQELTTNVLSHSQASRVYLEIDANDTDIFIIFQDNGIGFNYEKSLKKSSGLSNVAFRVQNLKGDIRVKSKTGKGTEIQIKIPSMVRNVI